MPDNRIDDLEERLLILRDKAAREGFRIPDEVLDYIANKFALPQTLKGGLINVAAYAQRRDIPVTLDVARLVLDGIRPGATETVVDEELPAEEPEAESVVTQTDLGEAIYGGSYDLTAGDEAGVGARDAEEQAASAPFGDEPFADQPAEQQPAEQQPAEPLPWERAQPEMPPFEQQQVPAATVTSLEDTLASVLDSTPAETAYEPRSDALAEQSGPSETEGTLFEAQTNAPVAEPSLNQWAVANAQPGPASVQPQYGPPEPEPAAVWFAPVRTSKKESLVKRAGRLLQRAGLSQAIDEGDLVAIKLHFGEEGSTGFVSPVFVREVVRLVREQGGKPFLTDSNTLYRGKRANAVDHLACAVHNGFSFATVEAPIVIADGLDGRDAVDVGISGFEHFDSVRIGTAAVHADAMIVVTHVKGHEAVGMGGAMKNVGMGLGSRSAKQRMHSDLKPHVDAEQCTACGRCAKWCPVAAIAIAPDRVATIDYELCYGCGECVAACAEGAIGIQWKTEPAAIQEKIVEHTAGALAGKEGKVVYLSFINNVSPDCDCWHFSDASIIGDIGVLASTDIVAIDQAAYDLVKKARGLAGTRGEGLGEGTDKFREVTGIDPTLALGYAERHGLGRRSYELKTLD